MNQKLLKSHTILAICILILSIIPVVCVSSAPGRFSVLSSRQPYPARLLCIAIVSLAEALDQL